MWPAQRYDYVPAERLSIVLDTSSRYSSKITWPKTKTLRLDSRLPGRDDNLRALGGHRHRTQGRRTARGARRAAIEAQKWREREDEHTCQAYVQYALGERLIADLKDLELVGRLRHYPADVADRLQHIEVPPEKWTGVYAAWVAASSDCS